MSLEWMGRAECRDHDPEMFFTSEDAHYRNVVQAASSVCMQCPVQKQCGEYADMIDARDGVWAGRLRVGPAQASKYVPPHGTEARAQRHRRQKQSPCPACLEAERIAKQRRVSQRRDKRPA